MIKSWYRKLLFDRADYELLQSLDEAIASGRLRQLKFSAELHPRGIRDLAESQTARLIRTMLNLLDSFDSGAAAMEQRLAALRSLRDELLDGLNVPLTYNTARVILQLLKELLRADRSHQLQRLRLAHDLRSALLGNPLFIRKLLRRYRLLEMPEHWRPVSFDLHVHDANTKGRKSPSHLIMDAWIKGIVKLQVVYYNYVPEEAAEELMRAAALFKLEVRIGVEFRTSFYGRFVELIWSPRGFSGIGDYLKFLKRSKEEGFARKFLRAASYRRKVVLEILEDFNRNGRHRLNQDFRIALPPVTQREFIASIRYGQPSIEHIGELLFQSVRQTLREKLDAPDGIKDAELRRIGARLESLSDEEMIGKYLNLELWCRPPAWEKKLPAVNRWSPAKLCSELYKISSGYRMTLNLSGLRLEDVIEILYDCRGDITALEIFNLKDQDRGVPRDDAVINLLRQALNSGNVVKLKELIQRAIARLEPGREPDYLHRQWKLRQILRDLPTFLKSYARSPLEVSLGSDSAERKKGNGPGMGLVVVDSLSGSVKRQVRLDRRPELNLLPVKSEVYRTLSYIPRSPTGVWGQIRSAFGYGFRIRVEYVCPDPAALIGGPSFKGNLATLSRFHLPESRLNLLRPAESLGEVWHYLNSNLKIFLKIFIGFAAAFITFYWNSSWWVLVYFGAVIWLGITAVRNVIQSIAASGGVRNSKLQKWNDFVSWQRVADSLLYTGLSVPLLEYAVKTLLLERVFGWTAESHPLLVFSGIAIANGFYISGHNYLRAFPKAAIWGNWLRAPLSIPLALLFNFLLGGILVFFRIPGVDNLLQQCAAVLSKLASDIIGGVIEARADRARNIAARLNDFRTKLANLFELLSRVELLLPDKSLAEIMRHKKSPAHLSEVRRTELSALFSINALDLMYIVLRQPQAAPALEQVMERLSPEERQFFVKTQEVLIREKGIHKLFLNGLVGRNYSKALAFYLHYYRDYLKEISGFARQPSPYSAYWRGIVELFSPRER